MTTLLPKSVDGKITYNFDQINAYLEILDDYVMQHNEIHVKIADTIEFLKVLLKVPLNAQICDMNFISERARRLSLEEKLQRMEGKKQ